MPFRKNKPDITASINSRTVLFDKDLRALSEWERGILRVNIQQEHDRLRAALSAGEETQTGLDEFELYRAHSKLTEAHFNLTRAKTAANSPPYDWIGIRAAIVVGAVGYFEGIVWALPALVASIFWGLAKVNRHKVCAESDLDEASKEYDTAKGDYHAVVNP